MDRIGTKLLFGIVAVAGIVAAIGVNSRINGGGDLPQLSDNDDDDNHVV